MHLLRRFCRWAFRSRFLHFRRVGICLVEAQCSAGCSCTPSAADGVEHSLGLHVSAMSGATSSEARVVDMISNQDHSEERAKFLHRNLVTRSIRERMTRSHSLQDRLSSVCLDTSGRLDTLSSRSVGAIAQVLSSEVSDPVAVSQSDLMQAWTSISPPAFPDSPAYTACYCEENVYLLTRHLSDQLQLINHAAVNIADVQRKTRTSTIPKRSGRTSASASDSTSACACPATHSVFVPVWDVDVVFMSNPTKSVLLYQQHASKLANAGWPVIWDYHVVAVATCSLLPLDQLVSVDGGIVEPRWFARKAGWCRSWVYDLDSRLTNVTTSRSVVEWREYNEQTFRASQPIASHFEARFRCIRANEFLAHFASDRSHMLSRSSSATQPAWAADPPKWKCIIGTQAKRDGVVNNLMDKYVDVGAHQDDERYGVVWDASTWFSSECRPRCPTGWLGDSIGNLANRASATPPIVHSGARTDSSMQPRQRASRTSQSSSSSQQYNSQLSSPIAPPAAPTAGGRIASPLFPAYLHASQQHRSQLNPASKPYSPTSFSAPL